MSSRHLLVLRALTSLFIANFLTQGVAGQAPRTDSFADLLLHDEIQKLESRLAAAPRTAETVAFQGEVEYRKGRFEQADMLYHSALQMNEKTARAHFGLGKLAAAELLREIGQVFGRQHAFEWREVFAPVGAPAGDF